MQPNVAIITLNWNGLGDTVECLNSLKKITYTNYNVVVVDNGSDHEEGLSIQDTFKTFVHVIKNSENLGFAQGNNIGIQYALDHGAEYVLLLNNDTTVDPPFLDHLMKEIQGSSEFAIGSAVPTMLKYEIPHHPDNLGISLTKSGLAFNRLTDETPLFAASGGCVLLTKKFLQDIRMGEDFFDKDFFCYAEDLDMGFRGLLKGYIPVRATSAIVYHKGSKSAGKRSDFSIYHGHRNTLWALIKNLPASMWLRYGVWIILFQILSLLYYLFAVRRPGVLFRAKIDALKKVIPMLKKRKAIQSQVRTKHIGRFITKKFLMPLQ